MLDWNAIYKSGRDFGELPEAVVDMILSYADSNAPKTFLDIGCGTGHLTRLLHAKGYSGLGIDPSEEAITIARSRSKDISYEVLDILDEESKQLAKSYGLITCKHVYAFIPNKNLFLSKVTEKLEKDGTFMLLTPLVEDMPEKPEIAVDGVQFRKDIEKFFTISLDRKLKSGQLFILKPKS